MSEEDAFNLQRDREADALRRAERAEARLAYFQEHFPATYKVMDRAFLESRSQT